MEPEGGIVSDQEEKAPGCPIIDIDFRLPHPVGGTYEALNEVRELSTMTWNETPNGFWMVNRYDEVKEALQRNDVFTNDIVSALGDPEAHVRLIPQNLNGREHVKLRHVVNPFFSPGALERIHPLARERCIAMIEELKPRGECDLAVDFAMIFPTEIFLALLGLPTEDAEMLLPLVEGMFRGFFGGDPDEMAQVVAEIKGYYGRVLADRLENPRDVKTDFVSYLLQADYDGQPMTHEDILTLCLTIMTAGLDTTRSALGYIFYHLATHPEHRQLLLDNPDRIPDAVEEFLRLYPLVIQDGRYVAEDVEFHGCPMKKGDILWIGLAQANRDPRKFDRPDEFVLDRDSNKHLAFAAGAHRCLGSHVARSELILVVEEWLRRIPHFELSTTEGIMERGGQLMLTKVPLKWEV